MAFINLFSISALMVLTLASGVYGFGKDEIFRDETNSTATAPTTTMFSNNISNLLTLLGFTTSRQAEAAILSQMVTSFLGLLATGKVAAFIIPALVSYMILPLLKIVKAVAKVLIFLGAAGWILSTMVPMFLGYLGLAGAGAFIARSMNNAAGPMLMQYTAISDPRALVLQGLQYLNMDSNECKLQIACKTGEAVAENFPSVAKYMSQPGVVKRLEEQARDNRYTTTAFRSLFGQVRCDQELPACEGLRSFESLFDAQRVTTASQAWAASLIRTTTTTTTTPPPPTSFLSNDMVVNAIRRLAQNYYGYDVSS